MAVMDTLATTRERVSIEFNFSSAYLNIFATKDNHSCLHISNISKEELNKRLSVIQNKIIPITEYSWSKSLFQFKGHEDEWHLMYNDLGPLVKLKTTLTAAGYKLELSDYINGNFSTLYSENQLYKMQRR